MELKEIKKQILLLCITIGLHGCDYVDIPDIFISPSSVNDRYEQSMVWNTTHPSKTIHTTREEYTIFNIADVHIGETSNLNLLINRILNQQPATLVINGDFVNGHKDDYDKFDATIFSQDTLPYFLTLGNHELYFDGWSEFYKRYGSSMYSFIIKTPSAEDLYICLDTGSGTLGKKQIKWLKDLLINKRTNYRNCVIFTHVNLFRNRHTTSTNPNVEELYVLLDLFAQYAVNMVITGHDHIRYIEKIGNTTHISIDALKDGVKNASFLKLQINKHTINYIFENI